MAMAPRLYAPVAAPPPPKPPQLNIVASALMPDVNTDTFGPGGGPSLSAAGWLRRFDLELEGHVWDKPPGDEAWRKAVEERNALVAAVGVMDDMELKQAEENVGVTVDTLPASIYPATRGSRWTGGFAYAPENQSQGVLADPCGQTIDLPALGVPVPVGVNSAGGSHSLTTASYDYKVTAVNANGETVGSSTVTVAVTTGSAALSWPAIAGATSYNVYGRTHSSTVHFLASTATNSYLDDGTATPSGVTVPVSNTTGGPGTYTNLAQVGFVPFLIQVEDTCSAFNWQVRDWTGRALRLLDNATPNAIEREFWSGAFAQNTLTGPMYDATGPAGGLNAFLTQSGTPSSGGGTLAASDLTPGGGPPTITRGIQILEDYLANTGFGGQGVLHVAPETSPNLLGARRVGSLLLSVMDNIIVPGSGYPTSGATGPIGNANATPTAGTAWMFATDLVSVRLDEPFVTPPVFAEALDRSEAGAPNQVTIRAQRYAAATWDQNRLAAVRVTLST
jgi:hypothetical protein